MKRILIIDDNLSNLKYVNTQLEGIYHTMLAKSGEQALRIVSMKSPDLILLDIDMPGMDGFETIERLKRGQDGRIPVIFLTASYNTEIEARALESGAVDFISKPVERSILLHRIGIHLELSGYQKNLEDKVKELENSIVISFAELIECRDENTGGHVQRTSRYVRLLGEELLRKNVYENLTPYELEMIIKAAPLHDIGKLAISDTILHKPSLLTAEEFAKMKEHPVIGGKLLENIYDRTPTQHYLRWAIQIAQGHHEKYDGSGYPKKLSGDQIPISCRIMAVADVYDALTSDRPYRKALSYDQAKNIIDTGAGNHFDPLVVDAFLALEEEFKALIGGE
ncbi:MAG: HD-GYP domain-containing protein [Lachnospiraceae bacterium]